MDSMSLVTWALNRPARVTALTGHPAVRQRLAEMGIIVGTPVRVVRRAPLGDPVQIEVRGYQLSLRLRDLDCIHVGPVHDEAPVAA